MEAWNQFKKGGNVMKRQIEFRHENDRYALFENNVLLFSIDGTSLQFDSLQFYDGVYKDKSSAIDLINKTSGNSTENYIFKWLNELVIAIHSDLNDPEPIEEAINLHSVKRIVPLFDMTVCAGNGDFVGSDVKHSDYETDNSEADYALKISGESMEPTIQNGAIVLVKKVDELQHNDIGIVTSDTETMCKRYIRRGRGVFLVPDNKNGQYKEFGKKGSVSFIIQGKVIEIVNNES